MIGIRDGCGGDEMTKVGSALGDGGDTAEKVVVRKGR